MKDSLKRRPRTGRAPRDVLGRLPDELARKLAVLHDAPPGIAESTIALLPFGSRCALVAYGVIERIPQEPDEPGEIEITPLGWAVVQFAARRAQSAVAASASASTAR
jgi:hypothetical protein